MGVANLGCDPLWIDPESSERLNAHGSVDFEVPRGYSEGEMSFRHIHHGYHHHHATSVLAVVSGVAT